MKLKFFVVLFCFFVVSATAALPKELTGREYSETILLLSESDFDVRLAAKSLYRLDSNRQSMLDLLAEVTWAACSGDRVMKPDGLSWLAKAIGNTKQARYAGLLDYCLSSVTHKKVIKYLTEAKDKLEGTTNNSFEGGKIDLREMQASLVKKGALASRNQVAGQFDQLRTGRSLDEIYSIFGVPNGISGVNIPRNKVGHMHVKIQVSQDMIEFGYSGLGTIRFAYDKTQADWLLAEATSAKGLFWSMQGGRFTTIEHLITTGNRLDLRNIADHLLEQNVIKQSVLDRVADRIYSSRLDQEDEMVDVLAWLCKVIAKSEDGRYKQLMLDVSKTAEYKKLRRYARKVGNDLPETSEKQYVPSLIGKKTDDMPKTGSTL